MISFNVPGEPQGKGRPRFSRFNGLARAITPARTRSYEALVALAAQQAMAGAAPYPRETPLRCQVEAVFSIPESWSKLKRIKAMTQILRPTKKPDSDNILKLIDAMNGIVWVDDSSVVECSVTKRYGEVPGLTIEVLPV